MSHFPCNVGNFKDLVAAFGAFSTQVPLNVTTAHKYASSAFTVPEVGSEVVVTLGPSDLSNVYPVGSYVVIGSRLAHMRSDSLASTGTGFYLCYPRCPTGIPPGTVMYQATGGGYKAINHPSTVNRTEVTGSSPVTLPKYQWPSTLSQIYVANRGNLIPNSDLLITNYAGLYQITATQAGPLLTVKLVVAGDLLPGETCVVESLGFSNGTVTGTPVAQGYPLFPNGLLNTSSYISSTSSYNYRRFIPISGAVVAVSTVTSAGLPGTQYPKITIGHTASKVPGRAYSGSAVPFGDAIEEQTLDNAASFPTGTLRNIRTALTEDNPLRVLTPFGMPLMVAVTAATNADECLVQVSVRGVFIDMPS